MLPFAYVRWKDACTEEAREGGPISDSPLIELHEAGWLVAQGEDSITLAMELETDGTEAGRWRLHIPKVNIIDIRVAEMEDLFKPLPKRRKAARRKPQ